MTAKELAEKIVRMIGNDDTQEEFEVYIHKTESLLTSALEDARLEEFHNSSAAAVDMDKALELERAAGFEEGKRSVGQEVSLDWGSRNAPFVAKIKAAAYEECAKIALDFTACNHGENCPHSECDCPVEIGLAIRQRAKELTK